MTTSLPRTKKVENKQCLTKKLFVIPGYCDVLGGTTVSLLMLAKGFSICGNSDKLCVVIHKNSFMEKYFRDAGLDNLVKPIEAVNPNQFLNKALRWVGKHPKEFPLLLDNCVWRSYLPILTLFSPYLR